MNYENFKTGFNKPAIFSAQTYGTKTIVEIDHSDLSLDEVMDAFQTLITGMGYHADAFKEWILERADEYREEDATENDEPYTIDDFKRDEIIFHEQVKQSIKDGLERYRATKEDEDEFDDYGQRNDKPYWDWDDVEAPQEDLVWGTEEEVEWNWDEPNEALKEAAEEYTKAMKAVPKKRKKKSVEDWENEIDLGGRE